MILSREYLAGWVCQIDTVVRYGPEVNAVCWIIMAFIKGSSTAETRVTYDKPLTKYGLNRRNILRRPM